MRVRHRFNGVMEIPVESNGVPALRLLAEHCPRLKIEATTEDNRRKFLVELRDLELGHFALQNLNVRAS